VGPKHISITTLTFQDHVTIRFPMSYFPYLLLQTFFRFTTIHTLQTTDARQTNWRNTVAQVRPLLWWAKNKVQCYSMYEDWHHTIIYESNQKLLALVTNGLHAPRCLGVLTGRVQEEQKTDDATQSLSALVTYPPPLTVTHTRANNTCLPVACIYSTPSTPPAAYGLTAGDHITTV